MEYVTKGYNPQRVLEYFEEICAIPHGSGNEGQIADYLCTFASSHRLWHIRDEYNNVFIKKQASKGYEEKAPVMLQGHMDMVCEKNADTQHDFLTDPLTLRIKDGRLMASGTTLGGDDGIALAYMLAILESDEISHPALECLITTGEETSMVGASFFDYSKVSARRIINIDSEEEGIVTVSCAGGCGLLFDAEGELLSGKGRTLQINVSGLAGGHSGTEINEGRANSIRIMGRILARLYDDTPFNLCSISGGNKINAIPRECEAQIYVLDTERAKSIIEDETAKIRKDLSPKDKRFRVRCKKGATDAPMLTYKSSSAVVNLVCLLHNGVYAMHSGEDLVRSSSNMGIITTEAGRVRLSIMARSSSESEMDAMILTFKRGAKAVGAVMEIVDRHPGWEWNPSSPLADSYVQIYNSLYPDVKGEAKKCAIHAGLECGIIVSALGSDADAVSIGPDIYNIHTPDEALDLASTERTYNVLVRMLAEG